MPDTISFAQGMNPKDRLPADNLGDLFLQQRALRVECKLDPDTGRLNAKRESTGWEQEDFVYDRGAKGHLKKVWRNGFLAEEYTYNAKGQRVFAKSAGGKTGRYAYDEKGMLARAGETAFTYDEAGNLTEVREGNGCTRYVYEETRLVSVSGPHGGEIRYEYEPDSANPLGPARKFKNNRLAAEYAWAGFPFLAAYTDHEQGLRYAFSYDARGALSRVRITGLKPRNGELERRLRNSLWPDMDAKYPDPGLGLNGLQRLFGPHAEGLVLLCGCDQVNTPKLFTREDGSLVKRLDFDSFGNLLDDSFASLHIPVGFAGGLHDPDTGLVRFGYRDYDPGTGRFTCPDPLGDTGGDHDLYDYCVDDPVSMNDPEGLFPPALYGLALMGVRLLPHLPRLVNAAMIRGHAAVHVSRHADKFNKAKNFVEGFLDPNPSMGVAGAKAIGAFVSQALDKIEKWRDNSTGEK